MKLEGLEFELEIEDDVAGFLGVHIDIKNYGIIHLTQTGLIDRIIRALDLQTDNIQSKRPANKDAWELTWMGSRHTQHTITVVWWVKSDI
jgi:hypothetical protein